MVYEINPCVPGNSKCSPFLSCSLSDMFILFLVFIDKSATKCEYETFMLISYVSTDIEEGI